MPKIDISITISVIVALCAIISPILTALINNHHQMKIKKLESEQCFYENTIVRIRTIFENYLKTTSRCIMYESDEALAEYVECYVAALIYVPSDIGSNMAEIHDLIIKRNWAKTISLFTDLAPKIADLINKL